MSTSDVVRALSRRWYLTLPAGTLLAFLMLVQHTAPGVYWTRFDVVLLPPADSVSPNSLARVSTDLSATAAVVTLKFNGGPAPPGPVSSKATLVGEGVRLGHAVRLRSFGGQWTNDFTRPVIDVQVVDSSPANVQRRAEAIRTELIRILAEDQAEVGADERYRISVTSASNNPVIGYQTGARSRAAAASLVAGAVIIMVGVVRLDRWMLGRRRLPRRG